LFIIILFNSCTILSYLINAPGTLIPPPIQSKGINGDRQFSLNKYSPNSGGLLGVIQRDFEPQDDNWWDDITSVEVMGGGAANKGLFKVKNGGNKAIVVKFTDEDPRRAVFADSVLSAAGVINAGAKGIKVSDPNGQAIANKIKLIGGNNIFDAKQGLTAQYISIMKMVEGGDAREFTFNEDNKDIVKELKQRQNLQPGMLEHNESEANKSQAQVEKMDWDEDKWKDYLNSSNFIQGLGRMYAADAVLGNSDRISQSKESENSNKVTINTANFKIIQDSVGAIDNDTELFSRQLLQGINPQIDTNAWVELLINGSNQSHIRQKDQITERPTQALETLFNEDIFGYIYTTMFGGKFYWTIYPSSIFKGQRT
jgi:hypothetical protein